MDIIYYTLVMAIFCCFLPTFTSSLKKKNYNQIHNITIIIDYHTLIFNIYS